MSLDVRFLVWAENKNTLLQDFIALITPFIINSFLIELYTVMNSEVDIDFMFSNC